MEVDMGAPLAEVAQEPEGFDLEAYANNYSGHARINRLLFIAEKCSDKPLELDALKLAADALKRTEDTQRYIEVVERIAGRAGPQYMLDSDWVERTDRLAEQKRDKLETDLASNKSNLIKESIRMGHNALGDHYYGRGDLQNAFKHYMRTRDYCTSGRHITHMCLQVVRCSVELGNYIHLSNYVQKAEGTPEAQTDPVTMSMLACASGLYCLEQGRYKAAALKFTEVSSDLGTAYNDVIAPQDVAVYGALCSMAALTRGELAQRVIRSVRFREVLGLVPEMWEAVSDFHASNYTSCLNHLNRLRPQLQLDPHLHDHIKPLYQAVRNKALIQYTTPFASLNLAGMAAFFNTSVGGIEKELAALIGSQQIKARIDSHAKVLYARTPDPLAGTYAAAVRAGEEYLRGSRALLLRASIMQHDLIQKPIGGGGGGGGGGGPDRPDRGEGPPRHGRHSTAPTAGRRERRGGAYERHLGPERDTGPRAREPRGGAPADDRAAFLGGPSSSAWGRFGGDHADGYE